MDERIRERFSPAVLEEALRRYGVAPDRARLLDAFESFMVEIERDTSPFILRLSHDLRRNEAMIQAEVDWLNYLQAGGASVAGAILSAQGNLVEAVDDGCGGNFLATAFVKAQGQSPWRLGWNHAIYEAYGQLIGRMHVLSQHYRPANPAWRRPHWDEPALMDVEHYFPANERNIIEKYLQIRAILRALPQTKESYGLIHGDAHGSNFFVDEAGRITLFDFDDCAYSWYANDIAIILFYLITNEDEAETTTGDFMPQFLQGYRRENRLDPAWLREFPRFLKLREIELYAVIHRDFDVDQIDNAWCAKFMEGRRQRIEQNVPYVDFDFESLAGNL